MPAPHDLSAFSTKKFQLAPNIRACGPRAAFCGPPRICTCLRLHTASVRVRVRRRGAHPRARKRPDHSGLAKRRLQTRGPIEHDRSRARIEPVQNDPIRPGPELSNRDSTESPNPSTRPRRLPATLVTRNKGPLQVRPPPGPPGRAGSTGPSASCGGDPCPLTAHASNATPSRARAGPGPGPGRAQLGCVWGGAGWGGGGSWGVC